MLLTALSLLLVFTILSPISINAQQDYRVREQEILKEILKNYDKRIRPFSGNGSGTEVSINLFVRSFDFIDDSKMEYGVQLTFRQEWNDARLGFSRFNAPEKLRFLTLTNPSQVWRPDLFFANEKKSIFYTLMAPNEFIRIFPNGDVIFSSRISLTLSCPMQLSRYPFDEQTCPIRMASYGYTNDDIMFKWKETDPIQVQSDIEIHRFALKEYPTTTCDSTTNTGTYSCLKVDFIFQREYRYYEIQIYIPCTMLVIVSYLSFWMDSHSVTARTFLGIATLFVMATQISSFNQTLPPVSYTKAIDVWTGICLTFVFSTLIEFIVVNYLARAEEEEENARNSKSREDSNHEQDIPLSQCSDRAMEIETSKKSTVTSAKGAKAYAQNWWSKHRTNSQKLDAGARVLYPVLFAFFCAIYFAAY